MSEKPDAAPSDFPFPDATVPAKTGRGWDEWFASLDEAGAERLSHSEIVAVLAGNFPDLSAWWSRV